MQSKMQVHPKLTLLNKLLLLKNKLITLQLIITQTNRKIFSVVSEKNVVNLSGFIQGFDALVAF